MNDLEEQAHVDAGPVIRLFLLFLLGFVSFLAILEWLPVLFPALKLFYEMTPTPLSLVVLAGNATFAYFIWLGRYPLFTIPFGGIWILSFTSLYAKELPQVGVEPVPFGFGLAATFVLVTALFRLSARTRIKTRVFAVSILSAMVPAFLMGLALYQQTTTFFSKQVDPMGHNMLMNAAKSLDEAIFRKADQRLLKFFSTPEATGPFRILSKEEYARRAQELGISVASITETSMALTSELAGLPETPTTIGSLVTRLADTHGYRTLFSPPELADRPILVRSRKALLGDLVAAFRQQSGCQWEEYDGTWFVSAGASASNTGLLTISLGDHPTWNGAFSLKNRERMFNKEPQSFGEAIFGLRGDHPEVWHDLTVYVPRRLNAKVVSEATFFINFGKLIQSEIARLPEHTMYGMVVVYPYHRKPVQRALTGYRFATDTGQDVHSFWENEDFRLDYHNMGGSWNTGSPLSTQEAFQGPLAAENIGQTGRVRVVNPAGEAFLFEAWNLPRTGTRILLGIPLATVCRDFFRGQFPIVLIAFVAILWAGLLSLIYSETLSRPIQDITQAAREIRDGSLETTLPSLEGQGEFQELAETLNVMAGKLKGQIAVANAQLVLEKAKFETLVESAWEGIFLLDGRGRILHSNPSGKQIFSRCPDELNFLTALRAIGGSFQPQLPDELTAVAQEFKTVFRISQEKVSGPTIYALYLKATHHRVPGVTENDSESSFIAVCRDITVEKEIERMKNDFVSQVSHELRTPLTSLQAYSEMLMDGEVEDEATSKEYLGIINHEAERLTRLINELLDIARIESGRRALRTTTMDLAEVTRRIVQVLKGQADKKGLAIEITLSGEKIPFQGDDDLITQLGLNLLSNAIKYTPDGGRVGVSLEVTSADIVWKFSDTGIGMTPKELNSLFTKFFRADSEYVRAVAGTGLGLPLVKTIVDAHHGTILVESEWQKGSSFAVHFPLA